MKKSKFIMIDLTIFTILACVAEFLSGFMFNYFNSGFYMSFSLMITIIVIVRWKYLGIIPAICSGIVAMIMNQFGIMTDKPMGLGQCFAYYVLANCFVILPILFYRKNFDESLNKKTNFIIFILLSFLFIALGKGTVIFFVSHEWDGFISYFATSLFTLVISLIFLLLFKEKTDLIVNMDRYIKDLQKED